MSSKAGGRFSVSPYDVVFLPVLGGMVVIAWVALAIWSASPYGRYVSHDWTNPVLAAYMCAAVPAGGIVLPAVLFVLGWVLMTVAMMLPTALPVLGVFGRLVGERADAVRLMAIVVGGYLFVWLGFGVAAHLLGAGVVALAQHSLWHLQRLVNRRCAPTGRGPVPVFSPEISLSRGVRRATGLRSCSLARPPPGCRSAPPRHSARRFLRRLLLGADAPAVRDGNGQRRMDGGAGRSNGD